MVHVGVWLSWMLALHKAVSFEIDQSDWASATLINLEWVKPAQQILKADILSVNPLSKHFKLL